LPSWLVMTQTTQPRPAEAIVLEAKTVDRKQISVEEIAETFQSVRDDIGQISRLTSEEKILVEQFLASMRKVMQPLTSSIAVSTSVLPFKLGAVNQAHIDSTGHLTLAFEDGHLEVKDLNAIENRDVMMAVIDDILPKFNDLINQFSGEKLQKSSVQEPPQIQEIPAVPEPQISVAEPEPLPAINVEPPVVEDLALIEVPQEEIPEEPPEVPEVPAAPVLSAEETAKIEAITAETLNYLEMLGGEVFEQAPVSKYFDDWMVNLRQVILSFESSDAIGSDETFTNEYNQIFGNIEDELANRQATEADIAVSARTLVENRYILNKIDEGYAAESKELLVKGKSAIEYVIRNVHQLEAELAEVEQIKTSYRHPLKKLAKEQKLAELTQKLNAAKKRLALTVGNSAVDKGKAGDIDAEYEAQTKELADKRNAAMDFLTKNVQELEEELDKLKKNKSVNPLKKIADQQKLFETTDKLIDAKKRLKLAEQNSSYEQEKLKAEYEKKKQSTLGKMQNIEKDIATKATDNSAEVRKEATKALANAVKSRIERKTAPKVTSEGAISTSDSEPATLS
jgi:hypothetical protein